MTKLMRVGEKGAQLLIAEEHDRMIIKPRQLSEIKMFMLLSESSLKKTWDNKYDERWDVHY